MKRIQQKRTSRLFSLALLFGALAFAPFASACTVLSLNANQYLDRGQAIGYDGMLIVHQGDGNVVAYADGRAVWSTGTSGRATTRLIMQGDGNLVLYAPGNAIWASNTNNSVLNFFGMSRRCGANPPTVGLGNNTLTQYSVFFRIFAYY
jgi:hypothetical protein